MVCNFVIVVTVFLQRIRVAERRGEEGKREGNINTIYRENKFLLMCLA